MPRLAFAPTPAHITAINGTKRWALSLGIWGAGAGAAALLFLSVTPVVRNGILLKIPVLSSHFEDKTPACDKSF